MSVRNAHEARIAIAGGCDILDVKEPNHGSLGKASPEVLQQVVDEVRSCSPNAILTAALGEVTEYSSEFANALPNELHIVKLGCAGLAAEVDWRRTWAAARRSIARGMHPSTGWVAVAYADYELARSPSPQETILAARDAGCRGVLFDTYDKSKGRLLDWLAVAALQVAAEQVHSAGMFLALAGSLRLEDLPQLSGVPADIIAIRGAACAGNQRTSEIRQSAIQQFRKSMRDCWQLSNPIRQDVARS